MTPCQGTSSPSEQCSAAVAESIRCQLRAKAQWALRTSLTSRLDGALFLLAPLLTILSRASSPCFFLLGDGAPGTAVHTELAVVADF